MPAERTTVTYVIDVWMLNAYLLGSTMSIGGKV